MQNLVPCPKFEDIPQIGVSVLQPIVQRLLFFWHWRNLGIRVHGVSQWVDVVARHFRPRSSSLSASASAYFRLRCLWHFRNGCNSLLQTCQSLACILEQNCLGCDTLLAALDELFALRNLPREVVPARLSGFLQRTLQPFDLWSRTILQDFQCFLETDDFHPRCLLRCIRSPLNSGCWCCGCLGSLQSCLNLRLSNHRVRVPPTRLPNSEHWCEVDSRVAKDVLDLVALPLIDGHCVREPETTVLTSDDAHAQSAPTLWNIGPSPAWHEGARLTKDANGKHKKANRQTRTSNVVLSQNGLSAFFDARVPSPFRKRKTSENIRST